MPHRTRPMQALLLFTALNAVLCATITPVYDFVCFLPYWERRVRFCFPQLLLLSLFFFLFFCLSILYHIKNTTFLSPSSAPLCKWKLCEILLVQLENCCCYRPNEHEADLNFISCWNLKLVIYYLWQLYFFKMKLK